jgi:hypothetical protein
MPERRRNIQQHGFCRGMARINPETIRVSDRVILEFFDFFFNKKKEKIMRELQRIRIHRFKLYIT